MVKDLSGNPAGRVSLVSVSFLGEPHCAFEANAGFVGTARFTYTITDRLGLSASATATISVLANGTPIAVNDSYVRRSGLTHVLFVTSNDLDPENDLLRVQVLTPAQHGSVACNSSCTYQSTAGYVGTDSFVYQVNDSRGGTAQATVSLNITLNQNPVASNDSAVGHGIKPISFTLLTNDNDPDGDPISVVSIGTLDSLLGTVSLVGGGMIVYSPPAGGTFAGIASFSYELSDGAGGTATGQVTVNWFRNNPPTKVDDPAIATVRPGEWSPDFYPLANDFDIDGDTLSLIGFTQPGHGTLNCVGDHCYYFLADLAFRGPLSFDYTISDEQGSTSIGTATFTVIDNRGPDAITLQQTAPPAGEAAVLRLADAVSDPDRWPVVGSLQPGPPSYVAPTDSPFLDVVSCTPNSSTRGSVSLGSESVAYAYRQGNGLQSITRPRRVDCVYTSPTPRPTSGIDTFSYSIRDWQGLVSTGVVEIYFDVTNPPADVLPSAASGALRVWQGLPETTPPLGINGIGTVLSATSSPMHGVASCSLQNTSGTSGRVTCSYRATGGYIGRDSFTYRITDYVGRTATGGVEIDARENRFPVAGNDSGSVTSGRMIYLAESQLLNPNPGPTVGIDLNDSEPDNVLSPPFQNTQPLGYSLLNGPQHGWLLPPEILNEHFEWIDPTRRDRVSFVDPLPPCTTFPFCRYRSFPGYVGSDSLTYAVDDQHGGLVSASVTFTVTANPPPVAGSGSGLTTKNRQVSISVVGTGPASSYIDVVTADTRSSVGGFVDCNPIRCTYNPPLNFVGTDTFTYRIVDGFNGPVSVDRVTVTVVVRENRPPVANTDVLAVVSGATKSIRPLVNDTDPDVGQTLQLVSSIGPSVIRGVTVVCNGDSCSYPAAAGFVGTDSFTYTVTDGTDTTVGTVVVTVEPDSGGPSCSPFVRTLSNGDTATADRTASIDVDGKGSFLTARYNPDGATPAGNTVYGSSVFVGSPVSSFLDNSCGMTVDETRSSASKLVTSGTVNGLGVGLTQELQPADATGSTFEQRYVFTNTTGSAVSTRLVRSLDGDLFFDGRKIDGAAASADGSILFEFDNTDDPSVASDSISITGSLDGQTVPSGWTIQPYSVDRRNDIVEAVNAKVFNDSDGNRITDSAYDVVLTQKWNVSIPAGGSVGFTTKTRFGRAAPNVVNVAPVAVDDNDIAVVFGVAKNITVLANDTDADNDRLTVSVVVQGTKGIASVLPSGDLRYVPAPNAVGSDSLMYEVNDGRGGTSRAVVRLVVAANQPPVAVAKSLTVDEDVVGSVVLSGTDPEGSTLTITISQPPAHGSVVCTPTFACAYSPQANYHGPDTFTYIATDGVLNSSEAVVAVTVVPQNDRPVVVVPSARVAVVGSLLLFVVTGTDVDGDALIISGDLPSGATLVNGTFTWTPTTPGEFIAVIRATDPSGAFDERSVSITVTPAPTTTTTLAPTTTTTLAPTTTTTLAPTTTSTSTTVAPTTTEFPTTTNSTTSTVAPTTLIPTTTETSTTVASTTPTTTVPTTTTSGTTSTTVPTTTTTGTTTTTAPTTTTTTGTTTTGPTTTTETTTTTATTTTAVPTTTATTTTVAATSTTVAPTTTTTGTTTTSSSTSTSTSTSSSTSTSTSTTLVGGVSRNVALGALAVASSETGWTSQFASKAVDGVVLGYPVDYRREWASFGGRSGSWIDVNWGRFEVVDRVVLFDRPNLVDNVTAGTIVFSDGSSVVVGPLSRDGSATVVLFGSRRVSGFRFTITGVSSATINVGLAEVEAWTPAA